MMRMSKKLQCTVLTDKDINFEGTALTFPWLEDEYTIYLSIEAMSKLAGQLGQSLYHKMKEELERLEADNNSLRDRLYAIEGEE